MESKKQRLLAESKLEFKHAFELAQTMESTNCDAKTLVNKSSTPVYTIPGQTLYNSSKPDNLLPTATRHFIGVKENTSCFKDAECGNCKKKDHIARACMSMPHPPQRVQGNR